MKDKHTFRQYLVFLRRKFRIPVFSVRLMVMFIFLLLFAKLVEKNVLFPRFDDRHAQRIQKIFSQKEQMLMRHMDIVEQCISTGFKDSCLIAFHNKYATSLKNRGLYFFVFCNDSLSYWSTKNVVVPETYSSSEFDEHYVSLGNNLYASGKYASFVKKTDNSVIVGLVLIKNVHVVENKYLKTAFQKDFGLPANAKIFPEQMDEGYPITDSNGQFVWSLIFDSTCFYNYQINLPALAYLLAIFVFLILLDSVFAVLHTARSRIIYLLILILILAFVRYAMLRWQIPEVFYNLDIFSPIYFGSAWFPSFGELCLWCIFISFFVFELCRYLSFPRLNENRWIYLIYFSISLLVVIVAFFTIGILLRIMVINSSDIFEGPNRILLFNKFSMIGYMVILLFQICFCLLLDKMTLLGKQGLTFSQYLIMYVIVLSIVIIAWSIIGLHLNFFSILFLSMLVFLWGSMRLRRTVKIKYLHYISLIFLVAMFTAILINKNNYEKYEDQKKILVTNLASQHDLTAEFLLRNISDRIISDTATLTDLVYRDFKAGSTDFPNVLNYLKRQYFYASYWNRYMVLNWVCNDQTPLDLTNQQREVNCVEYFRSMTETMGNQLPRSDFWFIDRSFDMSWYMGWFRKEKEGEAPLQLFIELRPGVSSDEVGYPELLLDERLAKGNTLKGYSYAKYRNNKRMSQYGDYKYNLNGDIFQTNPNDYHTVYADGMEHLVYRPDKNNMIVLSSYSPKPGDLIINFSYIFIIFFLAVSILLLFFYLPVIHRGFQWDFRNKIQYSMISVMLISFAVIGFFTVSHVNRQYQNKNNDIITEKMRAIHAELLDVILFHKNAEEDNEMLFIWLSDYQRLFSTDINLFDVHGQLMGTSLPDIFDKGMVGRQINPNAYIKLAFGQRASIMEDEEIGGLHYISAYEPFVDNENKVIAFLNLPYFTQQDVLTEEISNVVMTLLNFYMVIILLTVILSVVMSNQITLPLMMLQDKFRNIKLGEKNEPILYESRDEVGGLVKEYNRAIEELARSARRLARSERESAWREMARQIAHEINNPLTPMKLSIQHLKRAYDNNSERFDEYMEKISRSLVEQIDTLSAIATEFSNFAKMPAAHNERIDLIDKINNVVPLFAVDDNKRAFHTDYHGLEHAVINADKEQISRVFINLFKNALQAIPKDRQAEIHIDVLRINRIIWVRVKDNGMGIPKEMQEKIFRPNFTTKSSGMGLGLTIVHNIIEGTGGTINFKTRQDEGTTFIISFPAAE